MKNDIKFEEAMEKLEEEVRRLEGGNMTLDESLLSFENTIKLVKLCNKRLEEAEQKVRILTEEADGSVSDFPFDAKDDEA